MTGIARLRKEDFVESDEESGRGHSMKLLKKMVRLDIA